MHETTCELLLGYPEARCTCEFRNTRIARRNPKLTGPRQTTLSVPDSPKMIIETLCVAQTRIGDYGMDLDRKAAHIELLQRLIEAAEAYK